MNNIDRFNQHREAFIESEHGTDNSMVKLHETTLKVALRLVYQAEDKSHLTMLLTRSVMFLEHTNYLGEHQDKAIDWVQRYYDFLQEIKG